MKTIKLILFCLAVIGVGFLPLFMASANNQTMAEKRKELCPKVIQLEEKYKDDFWKEEGHLFCIPCCTKEAVTELAALLEYQQELSYSDMEIASTFKKLSHACYGSNILHGNRDVDGSYNKAKDFAKEAIRLDKDAVKDCLTLALIGVGEKQRGCKGGVCVLKEKKE